MAFGAWRVSISSEGIVLQKSKPWTFHWGTSGTAQRLTEDGNVKDCVVVHHSLCVFYPGKVPSSFMHQDHKPNLPAEKKRIEVSCCCGVVLLDGTADDFTYIHALDVPVFCQHQAAQNFTTMYACKRWSDLKTGFWMSCRMNFRSIRSIHLAVPLAIYSFLQAADGGVVEVQGVWRAVLPQKKRWALSQLEGYRTSVYFWLHFEDKTYGTMLLLCLVSWGCLICISNQVVGRRERSSSFPLAARPWKVGSTRQGPT